MSNSSRFGFALALLVNACGGNTLVTTDCPMPTAKVDAANDVVETKPDVYEASVSTEVAVDTVVEAAPDAAPDVTPDTFETDVAVDAVLEVAVDSGADEVSTPPKKTGCAASTYTYGDPVLFTCADELPMTETSGHGLVPIGIFDLVNYSKNWNHEGKMCIHYIGTGFLNDIHSISFVTIDVESADSLTGATALGPDAKNGFTPWPSDGRICASFGFALLPKSQSIITVYAEFQSVVKGSQYQFEIESPDDVSIDYDATEPVVGKFPVQSQIVTVVGDP